MKNHDCEIYGLWKASERWKILAIIRWLEKSRVAFRPYIAQQKSDSTLPLSSPWEISTSDNCQGGNVHNNSSSSHVPMFGSKLLISPNSPLLQYWKRKRVFIAFSLLCCGQRDVKGRNQHLLQELKVFAWSNCHKQYHSSLLLLLPYRIHDGLRIALSCFRVYVMQTR